MAADHHLISPHHHQHEHVPLHPNRPLTHHEKIVKNAQKLVSNTFFGTMLKQMHNSPFKSKLFSGGRGGEAFGSMLDQHLSDRMASGAGGKLVDRMVKNWEHPKPAKGGPPTTNQEALQEKIKRSGYRPAPTTEWRQNVTPDLRA